MSAIITDPKKIREFMLAGNSTFTVVSKKTGNRMTFRVRQSDDGNVYFVRTRKNNDEGDWKYLGYIKNDQYRISAKSKEPADSVPQRTFAWVYYKTFDIPKKAEFWHSGHCGRCGRELTDPVSIESGLGPVCRGRI